ncbi:hypothetical protein [Rhizobium straminoryzae]|uniref:Matrixin family metalloprotease n=1 Tax=Rhizobium straminoryzae TaxID=1387186 RepID=A0A549T4S4_9HYPH|nr:hypothetical protein [Rhizobium straminoryzae]TRL36883.1 hypothetical protein FNA46_17095 [Rhizobium straminoryzae]
MSEFSATVAFRSAERWLRDKRFPEGIDAILSRSNGSPQHSNLKSFLPGRVKRWALDAGPIPVFLTNDRRAEAAVALIDKVLERPVFNLVRGPGRAVIPRAGLVVSLGTAAGNPAEPHEICIGNVSGLGDETGWDDDTVDEQGRFRRPLCVRIDSPAGHRATFDQVVHEFGHALGLGDHFPGFGKPQGAPAVDDAFWAALVRLYQLSPGDEYADASPPA